MTLDKKTIEKAINWWAEKVTANQPHSNGDNGYTSIVTCLFADSTAKKISKKQVEVFKKELAMRIEKEAKAWTKISVGCDYWPCVMLEQATLKAGIPAANFPFKTWMYISEKDGIVVRDGYGAPPIRI
nr:MAG: BTG family protein [Bacteriophage sp.]